MSTDVSRTLSPTAARLFGLATIAAPLLLLGSTIAYINEDGINNGVVGGTIGVWSTIALVVAFAGLYRMIEERAPRVGPVFGSIALAGFTAGTAFNVQSMYLAAYEKDLLSDITAGAPGVSAIGFFAFLPWGWLGPVSFVATGILLWRTRTAPTWSAALLVLGGVLFVASRPERINLLAVACDITLVLALIPIGWSMLTRGHVVSEGIATTTPA